MARTTPDAVKAIITVASDFDVTPFIDFANVMVTLYCTGDNGPEVPYDDPHLELIERWLAAHLVTNKDPRLLKEKTGQASGEYEGEFGMGLGSSRYGQHVKLLDSNGGLAAADREAQREPTAAEGAQPAFAWLGTEYD